MVEESSFVRSGVAVGTGGVWVAVGVTLGLPVGVAVGVTLGLTIGVVVGVTLGLTVGVVVGVGVMVGVAAGAFPPAQRFKTRLLP